MRFVDGDLPPDEQSSMAAEIARDPDLAKRLEAFRFTREELVDAYAPTLQVPRELMERFLGPAAGSAPRHNRAKPSPTAISVLKRMNLSRQVMAMAAGAALLLAGASGWLLRDSLRPDYAGLVAPPSLQ
jgi:anti-sigma factor RsiW